MSQQIKMPAAMTQILELTKEGKLREAVTAIRHALQPQEAAEPAGPPGTAVNKVSRLEPPLRLVGGSSHAEAEVPLVHESQFITRSFTNGAGTRGYKVFLPRQLRNGMPLVVMLHGCTQTPDDFAAGTRMNELAESHGFLVAYPAQTRSANHSNCWNWFSRANQQRDAGEPSIIAGISRQIAIDYAVDKRRVYIAGLSAGGAMANLVAALYPDLFAAVGVHSGLANGSAHDVQSALAAMKQGGAQSGPTSPGRNELSASFVPTVVFHGDRDATVNPINGDQVVLQALSRAPGGLSDKALIVEEGRAETSGRGRSYTRKSYKDIHGKTLVDHWALHGARHAWSGGSRQGSHTDDKGPDASSEMVAFFLAHSLGQT